MSILRISNRVIGRTVAETIRLQAGYSELLMRPDWRWMWFGTFTYKEPVTESGADRDWNRFIRELNILCFGKGYRRRGETITYARGIEYQARGVLHFHSLLGRLSRRMNQFDAMKIWERCGSLIDVNGVRVPRTGFARIYEYDPSRGGLEYVVKYVGKGGMITVHCSKKTGLALQLRPSKGGPGHQQDLLLPPRLLRHAQQATLPTRSAR